MSHTCQVIKTGIGELSDRRRPQSRGVWSRPQRASSLLPTALLVGLLLHRLLTQDLTRRHEAIRIGQKMQNIATDQPLTVRRASFQVPACIPPGHWSSGEGSQCRRGCWKAEQAVLVAESAQIMLAFSTSTRSLNTNLGVWRTSCRCLRALPEVAIDCRCAFWFAFMMT